MGLLFMQEYLLLKRAGNRVKGDHTDKEKDTNTIEADIREGRLIPLAGNFCGIFLIKCK